MLVIVYKLKIVRTESSVQVCYIMQLDLDSPLLQPVLNFQISFDVLILHKFSFFNDEKCGAVYKVDSRTTLN